MAETQILQRKFRYEQLTLDDIDGDASPEEIKNAYSDLYPALIGATIEGPELKDDCLLYTFVTKIGTKGAKASSKKAKASEAKALDYGLMRSVCSILLEDDGDDYMDLPPSEALEVI